MKLIPGHARCVASELVANLLEASCFARGGESQQLDTSCVLLHLMLRCANVATLEDVVALELNDVARCSGYTERSVEQIFKRVVGESPQSWFTKVRLYGAVRELQGATPGVRVEDVARRWGFAHLSRFAERYRGVVGELPSQTLRRVAG